MIVSRTPFRITLGGGGTDLPSYYRRFGGFVLTAAIDKYMFISVNTPVVDELIRVKYTKSEKVDSVDKVEHTIVREAFRMLNITNAVEIISMADIPAGTGLGSSSTYAVGLLNALHTLGQESVTRQQLSEEACHIEIDVLRKPIGKQDQYIAAYGGLRILDIDKEGHVDVTPIQMSQETLDELEQNLIVFYTGISRDGVEILAHQDEKTRKDDAIILDSLHTIKEVGQEIKVALEKGDLRRFGELMHQHWLRKKALSKNISSGKIDEWYELARQHGALGGKITGAGGGGFLVLYAEEGKNKKELRRAMHRAGLRELRFRFDFEGTKILVNQISTDQARDHLRRTRQLPIMEETPA